MVKSPINQRGFCFWNAIMVKFPWSVQDGSAEVVFINLLYWKNCLSGKTVAFCKHKFSSLHNQAIKVIYNFQEAAVIPDVGKLLYELHRPVRRHLIESIYWWLPRLCNIDLDQDDPYKKTVMRFTVILPSFYFFVEIIIQRQSRYRSIRSIWISQIHLHNNYSYSIQLIM